MDAPLNKIWGPALWNLLHSLAEKSGKFNKINQVNDEKRVWFNLLNNLRFSLPCPLCKKHYKEYINKNPIERIISYSGSEFNMKLREWLFSLHENVNRTNGKYENILFEQLNHLYSNYNEHRRDIITISQQLRCALRQKWVIRDDITKTVKFIFELCALYCIKP